VRRGGYDIGKRNRVWIEAGRDETSNMCPIGEKQGTDLIGNGAESRPILVFTLISGSHRVP